MYNLGCFKNIRFYFGKNILLWPFPIGKPTGNGFIWERRDDFQPVKYFNNSYNGGNNNNIDIK